MRVSVLAAVALVVAVVACAQTSVPSVYPLQSDGKIICTASSINQVEHYWLTAAHCVKAEDESEPTVKAAKMWIFRKHRKEQEPGVKAAPPVLSILGEPVTVVMVDTDDDVAILSTPRVTAPALRFAPHAPHMGEAVSVVGFPLGIPSPVLTKGYVAAESAQLSPEDVEPYELFNVAGAPGNSGSAIVNAKGEVVSVLQVGWTTFGGVVGGVRYTTLEHYREYFGGQ